MLLGRYLPDSWHAVSCFEALLAACVGPENETWPSGVKGGTWVEKAESIASGLSGIRDQVGGWGRRRVGGEGRRSGGGVTGNDDRRVVKKAERSIPSRAENGTGRQQQWQDTKTGTRTTGGLATHPL